MTIKDVLKRVLERIKLDEEELKILEIKAREFCENIEEKLKKRKIKADVFIGGSLAKDTIMRKDSYDVDIFVRFDEKYKDDEISNLLEKCLEKITRIHGSRDYFQLKSSNVVFEIIPVIKISSPNKARNVTDLSFFHVSYVKNCIKKNKKLADEILLGKAFCYANNSYGAESYIKGFSGYALELLICYYKSFENFIKNIVKSKDKIIIDPEKFYKNKQDILDSLNEAKLSSPIVFVDPTNKNRNALAALSAATFSSFRNIAGKFIKKPSASYFEKKKINSSKFNLIIEARTNKQEGDIAGSKLLKFSSLIYRELEKYFFVLAKEFEYSGKKTGKYYFKIKPRKELVFAGPPINKIEALVAFKNKHKKVFIKKGKAYAEEKINLSPEKFLRNFSENNKKIIKSMGIIRID